MLHYNRPEFPQDRRISGGAVYSTSSLPPFVRNTQGIAHPKPGPDVAVCVAPAATTISRPLSWGAGQNLNINQGDKHIAQDAIGDSYPNMEYDTFYETGAVLHPASDDRAAFLNSFWKDRGFPDVEVRLGRKVRSAVILGEVEAEANGLSFLNHEGTTELTTGGYVLQSPDDANVMWFITRKVYDEKYLPAVRETADQSQS